MLTTPLASPVFAPPRSPIAVGSTAHPASSRSDRLPASSHPTNVGVRAVSTSP